MVSECVGQAILARTPLHCTNKHAVQGQVHWVNDTLYNCHTSCDLLNAGTFQSELEQIVGWLQENPFEVITMLIGNSDLAFVEDFVPAIENSGISQYLYTPKFIPQHKDQWPTLGEMILNNDRVVMFMDYYANQDSVPYIMEEFTHMWETPFSPQDMDFPCTIERPPGLDPEEAHENFMYIANHNLNIAVELGAITGSADEPFLIPNTAQLNNTNGQFNRRGQLEAAAANCTRKHQFPHPSQRRRRKTNPANYCIAQATTAPLPTSSSSTTTTAATQTPVPSSKSPPSGTTSPTTAPAAAPKRADPLLWRARAWLPSSRQSHSHA